MKGGVLLRALLKFAETSHLDGQSPSFAQNHILQVRDKDLNRKKVMMVIKDGG